MKKSYKTLVMEVVPLILLALVLGYCGKLRADTAPKAKQEKITLSDKNTVLLGMPIFGTVVSEVQKELLEKSKKLKRKEPIYLVLNTPGGSIQDGLRLIELAKSLPRPVHTISLFSASMGFIISQHLDDRLALDSSVLMSHRATVGGIGGQVPGNFVSMANFITAYIQNVSRPVAIRSGRTMEEYEKLIADDLWMNANQAKDLRFLDRIVTIECDDSLSDYHDPQTLELGFFAVTVQFHKCPLISEPKFVKGNQRFSKILFGNRLELMNKYGHLFQ